MSSKWESVLERWTTAGLIDPTSAERIRRWETEQQHTDGPNRLAAIAFGFGALLLSAGVFLFVSAHWDSMSTAARFGLALALVSVFHLGGAVSAARTPALSTALHAAGTAALGAGIYLSGQIFNMAEHWPSALLMWAIGAACALALLRDWPHTLLVAILVPTWLWGEWAESIVRTYSFDHSAAPVIGTVLLALAYLSAQIKDDDPAWRRTLSWLGAIAVIPSCILLGFANITWRHVDQAATPYTGQYLTWIIALTLPCLVAFFLRRRSAALLILPLLWSLVLVQFQWDHKEDEFILYGLYALGSVGIATWGVRVQRSLIVNLGIIAFALTTLGFYFSSILDKLNRSASLVLGGLLFLIGGWLLEKLRRRLIARMGAQP